MFGIGVSWASAPQPYVLLIGPA